jgi:precorrin-6B methylase 1
LSVALSIGAVLDGRLGRNLRLVVLERLTFDASRLTAASTKELNKTDRSELEMERPPRKAIRT